MQRCSRQRGRRSRPQLSMPDSTVVCEAALCMQYLPGPARQSRPCRPALCSTEALFFQSNVLGDVVNPTCSRLCAAYDGGLPHICKRCQSRPLVLTEEGPPVGCLSPPGTISALAPRLLLWLLR